MKKEGAIGDGRVVFFSPVYERNASCRAAS